MSRLIIGVSVLTLLLSATAIASPTLAKARRLTKYFENAHAAVVNGGVRPYAKVTNLGLQGRCLVGLQGGVSLATVVERGMVQKKRSLYGGATLGIQLGAGPEVTRMSYFGTRGMTGKEVLPTRESSLHAAACIFGERGVTSKQGAVGRGWDIGSYAGFGQGVIGRKVISTGKPQKSPMLQRLEEGLRLSGEVNAAIRADQLQGIGAKVSRLEHLRSMIAAEKRQLNAEHRAIVGGAAGVR